MLQRSIPLPFPIDVPATLSGMRRGRHDPCLRFTADGAWRATRLATGTATLHVVVRDGEAHGEAWGDGAEEALDGLADLIGANDDDEGFDPGHPLLARIWRDHRTRRIPRSRSVTEAAIDSVLEQRVTTFEARRARSQLVERLGEPAPGPGDLLVPPDPEVLAGVAYYDLHVLGVERKRADTVRRVAATARRLDALVDLPLDEARARLEAVPGVGPWTAAMVGLVALGDADAVPVGDVHLPRDITYGLLGEAVADDDAMLEALEPFAGQRGRVITLMMAAGIHAPNRSPRYAPRDVRDA